MHAERSTCRADSYRATRVRSELAGMYKLPQLWNCFNSIPCHVSVMEMQNQFPFTSPNGILPWFNYIAIGNCTSGSVTERTNWHHDKYTMENVYSLLWFFLPLNIYTWHTSAVEATSHGQLLALTLSLTESRNKPLSRWKQGCSSSLHLVQVTWSLTHLPLCSYGSYTTAIAMDPFPCELQWSIKLCIW